MALNFSSSNAASVDQGVKFLVHAPAGHGKTSLIATMPNPIILSAEAGLLSLSAANQRRMFGTAIDIPVLEIATAKDLEDAYQFISTSTHAKGLNPCLDSISEMAEVVLANLKKQVKDPRQAYGEMAERMLACIRSFRDLDGKHVYFSAKQEKSADTDGVTRFAPLMPGKQLAQQIAHFFDEVFALRISPKQENGSTYRFLHTRADIQYQAKDRSGALDEMEEPNLTKIINKITNK